MFNEEQTIIEEAATVIEQALHSIGSHTPIHLIDHGNAIFIGTSADHLTVRHQGNFWNVYEEAPYLDCNHLYTSIVECARDIALCDDHAVVFDHTEDRINDAIRKVLFN